MQGVYVDLRMLEATRRLITEQPSRTIPADNRLLVEQATHMEALANIEQELGLDWQTFGQELDGSTGAKASLAHLQALPYQESFDTLNFPDDEQKNATRLGAADRLIEFDPALPGPFGQPVSQLTLRYHQWPAGLPADTEPCDLVMLVGEGGFEFALGTSCYRYDRFGLHRLKSGDRARQTGSSGDTR